MFYSITKAVTAVSSIHRVKVAFRDVFYSQKHFPKILATSMLFSCIGGYQMMDSIHLRRVEVSHVYYFRHMCAARSSTCLTLTVSVRSLLFRNKNNNIPLHGKPIEVETR